LPTVSSDDHDRTHGRFVTVAAMLVETLAEAKS